MLTNGSEPTNTAYFRPALGGDMAVMRGMVKCLLQWEREAQASGGEPVFDHAFIAERGSGLDDRYRGVYGMRDVIFVNEQDIRKLGFEPGQRVDLVALWDDDRERRVSGFTLIAYDIPPGQAAAYYPETNPLVPLESFGDRTFTPTSKFVAIRLEQAGASNVILSSVA